MTALSSEIGHKLYQIHPCRDASRWSVVFAGTFSALLLLSPLAGKQSSEAKRVLQPEGQLES
jgi:hypothetical protein